MSVAQVFFLKIDFFDITNVENYLSNLGQAQSQSFDKSSRTYTEKLFSQFIRYFVFHDVLGVAKPSFSYAESGKPYLEGSNVRFSISHTKGLVVLAIFPDDIGVDVERIYLRKRMLTLAERFFSTTEYQALTNSQDLPRDFFTLWTLKESQVKKTAEGIAKGLHSATFSKNANGVWLTDGVEKFTTFYIDDFVLSVCCNADKIEKYQISSDMSVQKAR